MPGFWVGRIFLPTVNDGPNIKLVDLFKLVWTGLSLVCCLVIRRSTGGFLLLRYFSQFLRDYILFQWYCFTPWVLRVSQYVSVESSSLTHHRPNSWFVCTLFWFIDGLGNLYADQTFWITAEGKGEGLDPVKRVLKKISPPSNLLLTIPMRYFCCGSSVLHVMSVCIWSLAMWSAEYHLPIMLPFLFCFVI